MTTLHNQSASARAGSVWIFDLDNTLHDATPHIFPHINRSMTAYLQEHLQLDEPEADALRMEYWQRYGATLSGLIKHHGTNPDHFLWHTHQFPKLDEMVLRIPGLRSTLQRLPGKKLLYSNAPQHYAHDVLKLLKVHDLFDAVFALEQARYRPKPQWQGFRRLLQQYRLDPRHCIMVEDSAENLKTAKRLGMRTVWINHGPKQPGYVDIKIQHVLELPRVVSRLY